MSKVVKRVGKTIENAPPAKLPKLLDFTNVTKDISVLQTFYDFIDDSDCDAIDDYLSNNDFNDFLNFFASHHLYRPDDLCLIFKVCTEILMRIAGDLSSKYSLSGQAFAEAFISQYKSLLYLYFKTNKSSKRSIACLKFITGLILQSKDIALKVATELDFEKADFFNLLNSRKIKDDEDIHTCILNCYASFFIVGGNFLIRKICEQTKFVGKILRDLRFERFQNIQLMIEILHDKIVKNSSISKTTKVKFFTVSHIKFLLGVYSWKGAANSYDAYKSLVTTDDNCAEIHNEVHSLLVDLCSSPQMGIAFIDNLLGRSSLGNMNVKLFHIIKSDEMGDFVSYPLKRQLLMAILTACPDIVAPFVDHLVDLMVTYKTEFWSEKLQQIVECYRLLSNDKIDNILSEALSFDKGNKFIDIALSICLPTKKLIELLESNENIGVLCSDEIRGLRNTLIETCEKVLTWINISDKFYSDYQKSQLKSSLEESLAENYLKCNWQNEFNVLLSEELNDGTMFNIRIKETIIEDEDISEEEIGEDIADIFHKLKEINSESTTSIDDGNEILKSCCKHFVSKPFESVRLLKTIGETLNTGKYTLKKKYCRILLNYLTEKQFICEHWALITQEEMYAKSELKRNCIFDIVIYCLNKSKGLRSKFYERMHPLKLLSYYSASLSHSDQKLLYLIMLQKFTSVECMDYNWILFGNAIAEHYAFDSSDSCPDLRRPIINAQCCNLLEDDKFLSTISHFPIHRKSPISGEDQSFIPVSPQPNIYDPYFIVLWIHQLLNPNPEIGTNLEYGIDLKILFSKNIFSFLIACHSSETHYVRLVGQLILKYLLSVLAAKDDNIEELPSKMQLQYIIDHFFQTISQAEPFSVVSSIFTNFYIKILRLLESPSKKLFLPLINIFIINEKFDLRFVPSFQQLVYCKDPDAKLRQAWCFGLISESIKSVNDFRILLETKVFTHLFSLFDNSEQTVKKLILNLIKNCVTIDKVAGMMYNYPQFIMWLNFVANHKKDKTNHDSIMNIIKVFVQSLKILGNKKINLEELENSFRLYLPDIKF